MKYLSILALIVCWGLGALMFIQGSGLSILQRMWGPFIAFVVGCLVLPGIVLNFRLAVIRTTLSVLIAAGIFLAGASFMLRMSKAWFPRIIVAQRYQSLHNDYLVVSYKPNPLSYIFRRHLTLRIDDWKALSENIYYTSDPRGERND